MRGEVPEPVGGTDTVDVVERDHLADTAVRTAQNPAIHHDSGAEAIAGKQRHVVDAPAGGAVRSLRHRRERRVVVDPQERSPREQAQKIGVHEVPEAGPMPW
ncbi:hypothetical protein GCM10009806_09560 [Microbacterium flavum]